MTCPKITITTDTCLAIPSILLTQDHDIVAIQNKADALRIAAEIIKLANEFWIDNPAPLADRPKNGSVYADLIARGD